MVLGMFVLGAVVTAWGVFVVARRKMVVAHESRYGFDKTAERITRLVEKPTGGVCRLRLLMTNMLSGGWFMSLILITLSVYPGLYNSFMRTR